MRKRQVREDLLPESVLPDIAHHGEDEGGAEEPHDVELVILEEALEFGAPELRATASADDADDPEADPDEEELISSDLPGTSTTITWYLRQMGKIPLLSLEAEYERAQELDACRETLRRLIASIPLAVQIVIGWKADPTKRKELVSVKSGISSAAIKRLMRDLERVAKTWASLRMRSSERRYAATTRARARRALPRCMEKTADILGKIPVEAQVTLDIVDELRLRYETLMAIGTLRLKRGNQQAIDMLAREIGMSADAFVAKMKCVSEEVERYIRKRNEFVEANLRFVVYFAKKYQWMGMDLEDLISEGNIGLKKAADRFDYRRGCKFSTYAAWWIRQAITRAIANDARVIRLPVHISEAVRRMHDTERKLWRTKGERPTLIEIAEVLEIPVERVAKLRIVNQYPVSLDLPIGDDEEGSVVADFIEDTTSPEPVGLIYAEERSVAVMKSFRVLTPREEGALILRHGLDGHDEHTVLDIGRRFRVTRERARQLTKQAVKKLGGPRRSKPLLPFVESRR